MSENFRFAHNISMRPKTAVERVLEGDVDILALLNKLDFSVEEVSRAAQEQPKLFLTACRFRIQRMRRRSSAEARLESKRAEIGLRIRQKYRSTGDKITEAQLASMILRNSEVGELRERFSRAEEEEEFCKLLLEAFRMRRDAVRIVSEQALAEMNLGTRAAGMVRETEDLRSLRYRLSRKYPGSTGEADA